MSNAIKNIKNNVKEKLILKINENNNGLSEKYNLMKVVNLLLLLVLLLRKLQHHGGCYQLSTGYSTCILAGCRYNDKNVILWESCDKAAVIPLHCFYFTW